MKFLKKIKKEFLRKRIKKVLNNIVNSQIYIKNIVDIDNMNVKIFIDNRKRGILYNLCYFDILKSLEELPISVTYDIVEFYEKL